MEKKQNNYWADRMAKSQARLTAKGIAATEKQLIKYYQTTMEKIVGQFELTYNKVFSRLEEGKAATPADLYKLDSYWQMIAQTQKELNKLGNSQLDLFTKQFTEQYINIYKSLAIPSQTAFSTIDTEVAQQMISQVWCADGKSWSERIWGNTRALQETLNTELIECLVAGRKPTELKKKLQERFGVSYNAADSVVRTEMAHIQTQAAKQRYEDFGIKEVQVWADKDERRCDVCGKLHKKKFLVGAKMPIPAHPRCRCCIIPVIE